MVGLSFRARLLAIVGTAAAGFLVLFVSNLILSQRIQQDLDRIEEVYVPKLALGPNLEKELDAIARGLLDAVAVEDAEQLSAAREAHARFTSLLAANERVLDREGAAALRAAVDDYVSSGIDVSERMIRRETGDELVAAMTAMQAKQRLVSQLVEKTAGIDRIELAGAFSRLASVQRSAFWMRLVIIAASLTLVLLLSAWLGRGALRALGEITQGFERFGAGRLDEPIPVNGSDELAALAVNANRMAESLRRSVQELEAFNYSVSHDLRAPLRPLDGFSQALIEDHADKLDAKAADYLRRIRAAAQRMSQLIDDLLQLSRMGRTELVPKPCDMAPIADAVIAELRRAEPDRSVEFVCGPDLRTEGDPRLLRIVLENLLRNAWKFSRGVANARIELGTTRNGGSPAFFVRDNGAGFDPTYAQRLFQPFQRLHAATEFEGTGIGLAIVQRIVRRHEGRVWAESQPGAGATFYFTLYEHDESRVNA